MTLNEADRLDELLQNGNTAEPPLAMLVAVARQLEALRPVPPLPAAATASARQAFLAQASVIARGVLSQACPEHSRRVEGGDEAAYASTRLGMASPSPALRVAMTKGTRQTTGWLDWLLVPLRQSRLRFALASAVTLGLLIFCVSVMGRVPEAVQASLPGDRLYAYKIAQEDLGSALTFDPSGRVAFYVELVKQRSEELFNLVQAGRTAPIETAARLQQHLEAALLAASQLPDPQMESALEQIRQVSLSTQAILDQVEGMAHDDPSRITLGVAAYAVTNASALAEQGLADPQEFRALMSALPPLSSATPSSAPMIIYPPFNPTPVSVMPTATIESFNPPATAPTPSETSAPAGPTPISATATSTPFNPPTAPATPSATSVSAGPTPIPATATPIPTPTATETPEPPPFFTTPTPISQGGGN